MIIFAEMVHKNTKSIDPGPIASSKYLIEGEKIISGIPINLAKLQSRNRQF